MMKKYFPIKLQQIFGLTKDELEELDIKHIEATLENIKKDIKENVKPSILNLKDANVNVKMGGEEQLYELKIDKSSLDFDYNKFKSGEGYNTKKGEYENEMKYLHLVSHKLYHNEFLNDTSKQSIFLSIPIIGSKGFTNEGNENKPGNELTNFEGHGAILIFIGLKEKLEKNVKDEKDKTEIERLKDVIFV